MFDHYILSQHLLPDEDCPTSKTLRLRKCIAQRMVSHFDQERADKLTNRSQPNPSVPWLDGFIKVQDPDPAQHDTVMAPGEVNPLGCVSCIYILFIF